MSRFSSEEGFNSGWESHTIKAVYDFNLLYDFLPPAVVLAFLKRVCTLDLCVSWLQGIFGGQPCAVK